MKIKNIISIILVVLAGIIVIIGLSVFNKYRLWKEPRSDFQIYLKTFIPILVIGFSGTLCGIATLIYKDKK